MSRFVKKPNLPEGLVERLIIGKSYEPVLGAGLERLGIEAIWLESAPDLPKGIAPHADMSVLHLGGNSLLLASDFFEYAPESAEKLCSLGVELLSAQGRRGAKYPDDCGMNVCVIGDSVVLNEKTTDEAVKERLSGYRHINVAQGYARCSVCVVDECSVITADRGIAREMKRAGFSVLEISPGYIALEGYDYGFIGGASMKLSENLLAFTGRLDKHPDCGRILDFLTGRGVTPCFLSDKPIFDTGGAVPLTERK